MSVSKTVSKKKTSGISAPSGVVKAEITFPTLGPAPTDEQVSAIEAALNATVAGFGLDYLPSVEVKLG